jgi:uroporphyrin-III C-methyltransferase
MKSPKLTLIGAGPGDKDLITVKGIKALQSADVILYDALANEDLLTYAREDAIRLFVGKRAGQHLVGQRQINRLIVHYAYQFGHVVRLKGGDPYVFGRGHEEKIYAESHGISVDVVPGISSALAVPATNHIPLTRRGVSESFWVITGTTRDEQLSADLELAAKSSATVVILMGMKKLDRIVDLFTRHRGAAEAVAIIQRGTCPDEKTGIGCLQTIQEVALSQGLDSPAIIVIGAVVKEHPEWVRAQVNVMMG